MAKTKLGLQDLTVSEKIEMGQRVASSLENNPRFPNAGDLISALSTATSDLTTAHTDAATKRQAAQLATEVVTQKEEEWNQVMNRVGGMVEMASNGDTAVILSAGVGVRTARAAVGVLPAPANLTAEAGAHEGTIDLSWKPLRGASSYEVQQSLQGTEGWEHVCSCTRSKVTVSGLSSGTRHYFRVRAVGAAGAGPWSDTVNRIAS
jgi:hypothetical protein